MAVVHRWYRLYNINKTVEKWRNWLYIQYTLHTNDQDATQHWYKTKINSGFSQLYQFYFTHKRMRVLTHRIRSHVYVRTCVSTWLRWLHAYRERLAYQKGSNKAIDHYLARVLRQAFGGWRGLMARKDLLHAHELDDSLWDGEGEDEGEEQDAKGAEGEGNDSVIEEVTEEVSNISPRQLLQTQSLQLSSITPLLTTSIDLPYSHHTIIPPTTTSTTTQPPFTATRTSFTLAPTPLDLLKSQLLSFNAAIPDDTLDPHTNNGGVCITHLLPYIRRWRHNIKLYKHFYRNYTILSTRHRYKILYKSYCIWSNLFTRSKLAALKLIKERRIEMLEMESPEGIERYVYICNIYSLLICIHRYNTYCCLFILYHMYMLYRRRQLKERLKESETRINTLKSHQNATILRVQAHHKDQLLHQKRMTDLTMSIEALYKDENRLSEQVELINHQIKLVHLEAEAMQSEAQQQYTRVDQVSYTLFIVLSMHVLLTNYMHTFYIVYYW